MSARLMKRGMSAAKTDTGKWTREKFETATAVGPVEREGYTRGAFGISRDHSSYWVIYHLPSGMMFLYSAWDTLRDARRFADKLLELEPWTDERLAWHADGFNEACHKVAAEMGLDRRAMRQIG